VYGTTPQKAVTIEKGSTGNKTYTANWTKTTGGGNVTVGTFIDSRDRRTYKTVVIDSRTWMAENLNYNAAGSVCYDNDPANCDTYGRLYKLGTAKTACPAGWHLPSRAEWTTLVDHAGGSSTAGSNLKSQNGWNSHSDISSTDEYGFSALPGGSGWGSNTFVNVGYSGEWWVGGETVYNFRAMDYSTNVVSEGGDDTSLRSVRCTQD